MSKSHSRLSEESHDVAASEALRDAGLQEWVTPEERLERNRWNEEVRIQKLKDSRKRWFEKVKEADSALKEEWTPEEEAEIAEAMRNRALMYKARRARAESLLTPEAREQLALDMVAYKKAKELLSPEEAQAKKDAARERARLHSAKKREERNTELLATGQPLPHRGRPRKDGLGPEATPEELHESYKARNREAQKRWRERQKSQKIN